MIVTNSLRLEQHSTDLICSPLKVPVLAIALAISGGKPRHIRKLVSTINALSADAVLITGDWLYYPSADLVGQLMLFKGVNKPVYTVMSTSDLCYQSMNTTKQGQPLLEDTLASTFDVLDIKYIGQQCTSLLLRCASAKNEQLVTSQPSSKSNQSDNIEQDNSKINSLVAVLCGWQDMPKKPTDIVTSEATDKAALRTDCHATAVPLLFWLHDLIASVICQKSLQPRPLLITGAAKAIQKNILLAQKQNDIRRSSEQSVLFYNSRMSKQRGLYQHANAQIFVSSGIGTRGLPFRFYRPTIDVLTIR